MIEAIQNGVEKENQETREESDNCPPKIGPMIKAKQANKLIHPKWETLW
jgi:hypothetical protein